MRCRQVLAGGSLLLAACGAPDRGVEAEAGSAARDTAAASRQPSLSGTPAPPDTQPAEGGTAPARRTSGASAALPAAPLSGSDTARGVVRILGTVADSRVVVHSPTGPVAIIGPLAPTIAALQEMDVWVQGPLSVALGRAIPPRQIEARQFAVRAVNGVAALDGTLREESGGSVLVSAAGERTRLVAPPPALRSRVGSRVWVTRDGSGAVSAFGVIE